jgi:hypothetical protein
MKAKRTVGQLLDSLTAAVGLEYPGDVSRAGVVVSDLGPSTAGRYYASICRYPTSSSRTVVCVARAATLHQALVELGKKWLGPAPEAKAKLRELLK